MTEKPFDRPTLRLAPGGASRIFSKIVLPGVAAALFFFITSPGPAQMIDLNTNGMSDTWEQIYGASAAAAGSDDDGDGFSNAKEALAATSPFNSNSVPKISASALAGTNFTIALACELGKQYQLQSVANLGDTNWIVETNVIVRSGTTLTLKSPAPAAGKFFRTAVSDVDTDGDGLNDWEEYKLGLDPFDALSNGQLDNNGQLLNDYNYAAGKFGAQNIFSITATDPTTVQPDPGQSATDTGTLTISRGGFPLKATTVNVTLGTGAGFATEGLDHTFLQRAITFPVGVSSQNISVTPLANTNLQTSVIAQMKLFSGTNYSLNYASNASVVIYPSVTPTGTGLTGNYYSNSSTTYGNANNFAAANLRLTRVDPTVDYTWGNTTNPITNAGAYTVRWTGQVQPQYSEPYYFLVNSDDGCKLWVNDQLIIDKWQSQNSDQTGVITLQGGVRYNIRLEYLQVSGSAGVHLYWYSPSQSKIIIPSTRLYPTNTPAAPSSVTSPLYAVAFLGQPFSFAVTGANSPTNFTATGLPPGLSFTPTNGLISGIPGVAGNYFVTVTASNGTGLGASLLNLQVLDTGSAVVREVWLGVPGTNIADIPANTPATLTNTLGALEGITNYGANYAERIRGYLTATNTGNYYFWISGSDSAELWIGNDNEPVNKLRRAAVSPGGGGTTFRNWTAQTNQQSKWLSLVAGQKYYVEILHKAGTAPDHWSVGWAQDPVGTNTLPKAVVPGYVLSKYYPLPVKLLSGTLYSANMLALPGVNSTASGTATLLVNASGTSAILNYSVNGIVGGHVDHIYSDPYLNKARTLMFDIAAEVPQADGSYVWPIIPVSPLTVADIQEILIEGKATIEIQSAAFPNGEIGGHFTLANGSQTFAAPPLPPAWTDDHLNTNAAARFLIQSTFGPSATEIANVQSLGYDAWISNQFVLPVTRHLPMVVANRSLDPSASPFPSTTWFNAWWQQAVTAPDQLRQRVAFALSEIMVVSEVGVLEDQSTALAGYYDTLLDYSFGNFRDLLKAVTLSPAMGLYLDMRANDKGSLISGLHANENYAREILQLFSVGLYRQWPDGSLILDSKNSLIPTYDQNNILGFASTFTGWNYYQTNQANGRLPTNFNPASNYTNAMVLVPTHHELDTKKLLDNVVIPAAFGTQTNSTSTNYDIYCSQNLEAALDSIYYNPNVGPFICRQLIQRLVTANPSRDYLYRVVQKFNDNGSGVRGDLKAVVRAILTDYEARGTNLFSVPTYGKQREPLLRVTAAARALPAPPNNGGTYVQSGTQTITLNTTNAHRLNNNDTVNLFFTDASGFAAPPSQAYSVTSAGSNTLTLTAPNLATGTYSQQTNIITVTISSHGLAVGDIIYLSFTSGGAASGLYQVATVASTSVFTVTTLDSLAHSGGCVFPRIVAAGYSQVGTNVTVICNGPHGLGTNQTIYINANAVSLTPGQYLVKQIPDATRFVFFVTNSATATASGFTLYPFGAPPLNRSGTVSAQFNTWKMDYTDTSGTYNLAQSPLRSPTVFNYFYPDYSFPGALASAGLTTPEFQLTSDTSVALQMNFLQAGILGNAGNTNGLSSYNQGNGAIVLDLGPWMTTNLTATAKLPALVDGLNSLLLAGQLSDLAKTNIINHVATLAYSSPPTATQQRDRVRAVVHLLVCSPEFTVQK